MSAPKIIALCGKPQSGKSTAAELLHEAYDYEIVDDALPLRKIAMDYLGLTEDQVFTQAGKAQMINLNGRTIQVREILGELGNAFEEKFGADIIPLMSYNQMKPNKRYVLGSVRREQGHFWSKVGATVIEIDNPEVEESKFEFDRYSSSAVHHTILNDGLAKGMHEDDALELLMNRLAEALEVPA